MAKTGISKPLRATLNYELNTVYNNKLALLVATIAKVPNISQFIQSSCLQESIRNLLTYKNYIQQLPGLIYINTEQYLHTHYRLSNLRLVALASTILSINHVRHCYVMSQKTSVVNFVLERNNTFVIIM